MKKIFLSLLVFFSLTVTAQKKIRLGAGGSNSSSSSSTLGWYNVEDFGAVAIDPTNPTASADATDAIQTCINYAFSHSKHSVIYLPGMYKLSKDPGTITTANTSSVPNFQLYIPITPYLSNGNMDYHSIRFVGKSRGNFEAQGIVDFATPYDGSGFYSTWVESNSSRASAVIGFEPPSSATAALNSTFGPWNYTALDIDDIKVITTGKVGTTNSYMSGIDFSKTTQVSISRLQVRTQVSTFSSVQPSTGTVGIRMPTTNNHAVLTIGLLYASGFETGASLGEHTSANYIIAIGNKYGIDATATYPIWISHYCSENNIYGVRGNGNNTSINIGSYQGENYDGVYAGSKWYNHVADFYTAGTGSLMHVTINYAITHKPGGAYVIPKLAAATGEIDFKMLGDEKGLSQIPLNIWTTATRPTAIRSGIWGYNTDLSSKEYWNGTSWVTF